MAPLLRCCLSLVFCVLFTDAVSSNMCWYQTLYNASHPTTGNSVDARSDIEPLPTRDELAKICPQGSQSLAARCRDNKGEAFHGLQNRTCGAGYLLVNCDAQQGLNCTPYDADCTCPDFNVQYGCDCPLSTTTTVSVTTRDTTLAPSNAYHHSQTTTLTTAGSSQHTGNQGRRNTGSTGTGSCVAQVLLVLTTFALGR